MARQNRRRGKPSDPAEIARRAYEARRNPALWGVNSDALNLPQNSDVHTTQPETRTKTRRIERFDCFSTLQIPKADKAAVERFEELLAEVHRCGGTDKLREHIDQRACTEIVSAKWIDASNRLDDFKAALGALDYELLEALCIRPVVLGQDANWKLIVRKLRGLIDRDAASSCVKSLAENVRLAYAEIDGMQRRAA